MEYTHRVRHDFSRAAATYDLHAELQRNILEETAALLQPYLGATVLDAGCGTGYFAKTLNVIPASCGDPVRSFEKQFIESDALHARPRDKPGVTIILQLDSAEGMCRTAAPFAPAVCADMAVIPLADNTVDSVFSSLAVQWMDQPEQALKEFFRITRPGGYAAIATLGPSTLQELRHCFESLGLPPSVLSFEAQTHLADRAQECGWKIIKHTRKEKRQTYPSFSTLLHQLKGLGATFKRQNSLLTPGQMKQLQHHYQTNYSTGETIFATFDVITLLLQKIL